VTVTKIGVGLGVSAGIDLLLAGVGVVDGVVLLVLAMVTTVVVTSLVMVGPGLTTWMVLVGAATVVVSGFSVDPPSTLMTE
jgi:ABC-type uncharacterized transport system permease subunit